MFLTGILDYDLIFDGDIVSTQTLWSCLQYLKVRRCG